MSVSSPPDSNDFKMASLPAPKIQDSHKVQSRDVSLSIHQGPRSSFSPRKARFPTTTPKWHQSLCHFVERHLESRRGHLVVIYMVALDILIIFIEIGLTLLYPNIEHGTTTHSPSSILSSLPLQSRAKLVQIEVKTDDSAYSGSYTSGDIDMIVNSTMKSGQSSLSLPTARLDCQAEAAPEAAILSVEIFGWLSFAIICLFTIEVTLRAVTQLRYFFHKKWNISDMVVVYSSFIMELIFRGVAREIISLAVVLRLWRVVRLMHAVSESVTLEQGKKFEDMRSHIWALEMEVDTSRQRIQELERQLNGTVDES